MITQDEVTKILATVVDRLKAMGSFQNIIPIPSAKVPIVKFTHQKSRLEGDISLSNILALHNTKMLATYCAIDNRLKVSEHSLRKFYVGHWLLLEYFIDSGLLPEEGDKIVWHQRCFKGQSLIIWVCVNVNPFSATTQSPRSPCFAGGKPA